MVDAVDGNIEAGRFGDDRLRLEKNQEVGAGMARENKTSVDLKLNPHVGGIALGGGSGSGLGKKDC